MKTIHCELHSIELKHRILEMWKLGYSIEYTSIQLDCSRSKIEKLRQLIQYELEFDTIKIDKYYSKAIIDKTYKDHIIEELKR